MAKKKLTKKQIKRQMRKTELVRNIVLGIAALAMGVIFAFFATDNKPVTREEAQSYSGALASVDRGENFYCLHFTDGAMHELYPHTVPTEVDEALHSLPIGTTLHLLINPNNRFIAEIRTDTEELLNFEASQQAIENYEKGYVWIGGFVMLCGVILLIVAPFMYIHHGKTEKKRWRLRPDMDAADTPALRTADTERKSRVLAEATHAGYRICYRRVGRVNELVINDRVYDEHKALVEFEHILLATINGHEIEAGLDADSHSYIAFDGCRIVDKTRLI